MKDNATSENFQRLLDWLDRDPEIAGHRYELIRRRLIRVFAGRGCFEAEHLADLTFDRVLKKIPNVIETYVGDPSLYFYNVGRKIHLEWLRTEARRGEVEFDRISAAESVQPDPAFDCLDECLNSVTARQRELLLAYYQDGKRAKIDLRRAMAADLGITPTALQIRMHRIRKSLRGCVEECVAGPRD